MRSSLRRAIWRLVPGLVVAACASSGGSQETAPATPEAAAAGPELAVIEVQNNVPAGSTMTIMIEPQAGGVRAVLGTVEPGQNRRFSYNASPGSYTLIAQGADRSSPSFRLSNKDMATWDMQTNRVMARAKK